MANLTQRLTVLSQSRDEKKVVVEAGYAKASSRADDFSSEASAGYISHSLYFEP